MLYEAACKRLEQADILMSAYGPLQAASYHEHIRLRRHPLL